MKRIYYLVSLLLSIGALVFTGCGDDDDPPEENEEEIINFARLTFILNPAQGQTPDTVSVEAFDVDADGPLDYETDTINLLAGRVYTLSIEVESRLEGEEEVEITPEIRREATAHQFFFAWTGQIFESPTGLGNFLDDGFGTGPYGNENGIVNYADVETTHQSLPLDGVSPRNDVPVGLLTTWETGDVSTSTQQFRVVLKHQPGIKTADTNSNTDGSGTDLNATFSINIVQ